LGLDDPVSKFLPEGVKLPADPRGARYITLRHLATHSSGLPRNPVSRTERESDPWNGYSVQRLYEGLARTKLAFPTGASGRYSNLGVGLLGHALGRSLDMPFEDALRRKLLAPLGMSSTRIAMSPAQLKSVATPYARQDPSKIVRAWDYGCLAGCGGITSNLPDLRRFVSLNLRAGLSGVEPVRGASLTELHTPQRIWDGWSKATGLVWIVDHTRDAGDIVWHSGGSQGFASWLGFSPRWKIGVIVLTNCGRPVDDVGNRLLRQALKKYRKLSPKFRAMAERLVPHLVATPGDKVKGLFHEDFLKDVPFSVLKNVLSGLAKKHGACSRVLRVDPADRPELANVVFQFADLSLVTGKMGVSEGDPAKIVYLRFGR
jgi:CubicO group peptidase (beta-lactamase class C family)